MGKRPKKKCMKQPIFRYVDSARTFFFTEFLASDFEGQFFRRPHFCSSLFIACPDSPFDWFVNVCACLFVHGSPPCRVDVDPESSRTKRYLLKLRALSTFGEHY